MFKRISLVTALLLTVSTTGALAAVPMDAKDKGVVGYSWHSYDVKDSDWSDGANENVKANEFYGAIRLNDKWALDGDRRIYDGDSIGSSTGSHYENTYLTYGVQYKINENVSIVTGHVKAEREFTNGATKAYLKREDMYFGIAAKKDLNQKTDGYLIAKISPQAQLWTVGVTYDLKKNAFLDLNYTKIKTDFEGGGFKFTTNTDGFGVGLGYKF